MHRCYGQATVLMRRGGGLAVAETAQVRPLVGGTDTPYPDPLYGTPDATEPLSFPQATGVDGVVAFWSDTPARLDVEATHPLLGTGRVTLDVEPRPGDELTQGEADLLYAPLAHTTAPDPHPQYATDTDLANHLAAPDAHPQYLTEEEADERYVAEVLGASGVQATESPQGTVTVSAVIDPDAANSLELRSGGLFVPVGAVPPEYLTEDEAAALFLPLAHAPGTDPHPQYATDTDFAAHLAAADPHPVYLTQAEATLLFASVAALAALEARVAALEASVTALRTHRHELTTWAQGTATPTGGIP